MHHPSKQSNTKVSMKSTFPVVEVQKILLKEGGNATDETLICESQREKFRCQKCYGESFLHLQYYIKLAQHFHFFY